MIIKIRRKILVRAVMGRQGEVGEGVDRVMDEGQGVRGGGEGREGSEGKRWGVRISGECYREPGDCSCCLVFENFALSCFLSFYFVL